MGDNITVAQSAFLQGTAPDAVILTVSPEDDISYIFRTINHIEAYVNTKVVAVVIVNDVNSFCLTLGKRA